MFPNLNSGLCKLVLVGELLPRENVRVVRRCEDLFQFLNMASSNTRKCFMNLTKVVRKQHIRE